MIRVVTIDHSNPAELAAFHAAWKLPAHRDAAIQARAEASRQFDSITRQDGVRAAIHFAMNRSFKGATHP